MKLNHKYSELVAMESLKNYSEEIANNLANGGSTFKS